MNDMVAYLPTHVVNALRSINLVVAIALLLMVGVRRERAIFAVPSDAKAVAVVIGMVLLGIGYASAENLAQHNGPSWRAPLFTLVLAAIGWLLVRTARRIKAMVFTWREQQTMVQTGAALRCGCHWEPLYGFVVAPGCPDHG